MQKISNLFVLLLPVLIYKKYLKFWGISNPVRSIFFRSSLRTNRDCLASLKCRTPCQNRHDYRLDHPQGRQDQKTTQVKANSL